MRNIFFLEEMYKWVKKRNKIISGKKRSYEWFRQKIYFCPQVNLVKFRSFIKFRSKKISKPVESAK